MTTTPRPVVAWFADQIEAALQRNDGKPHWGDQTTMHLVDKLREEADELIEALFSNNPVRIQEEAADLSAIALMLADRSRATPSRDRGRA